MEGEGVRHSSIMIGTMIEIPRAALTADEIAEEAEFFSFGTNDLTQMTFGFSRDDAGKFSRIHTTRLRSSRTIHLQELDQVGVGKLVKMAVELGKRYKTEPSSWVSVESTVEIRTP